MVTKVCQKNELINAINTSKPAKNNKKNIVKSKRKEIKKSNVFSNNYIEYKSNEDKNKTFSIKDYLDEIKPYLSDIINNKKIQGEWKINLTMAINFFSSKDSEEIRTMHSKSDNIEILIGNETD